MRYSTVLFFACMTAVATLHAQTDDKNTRQEKVYFNITLPYRSLRKHFPDK